MGEMAISLPYYNGAVCRRILQVVFSRWAIEMKRYFAGFGLVAFGNADLPTLL